MHLRTDVALAALSLLTLTQAHLGGEIRGQLIRH